MSEELEQFHKDNEIHKKKFKLLISNFPFIFNYKSIDFEPGKKVMKKLKRIKIINKKKMKDSENSVF